MAYLFLILSTGLFVVALRFSGAVPQVRFAMAQTREALAAMSAGDLSEEDKETAVQKAALRMFGSFLSILLRTALCVGVPVAFVALGLAAGLYHMDDVVRAATNAWFIAGSTAAVIVGMYLAR
ncbi:MAG TPA: hypothetical protein VK943_16395 [Arenibaculum sp.]|nr:hypothetical protein [Arenibaculum sp.]